MNQRLITPSVLTFQSPLLACALACLALGACTGSEDAADEKCTEAQNCYEADGQYFCDDGFVWENSDDPDNFNCVEKEEEEIIEEEVPTCDYPARSGPPREVGAVMPDISYDEVYYPGHEAGTFGFDSFFCSSDWDDYYSITVIMVTEWCVYCPGLVEDLSNIAQYLAWNRSLLVFMVLQDSGGARASSTVADDYITGYIGADHGIRIGDGEASMHGAFDELWPFVPNGVVIDRQTMEIYAHAAADPSGRLDYLEITEEIYMNNR